MYGMPASSKADANTAVTSELRTRTATSPKSAARSRMRRATHLASSASALAASALQALVQGYADESGVTVRELNVAGAPDSVSLGGAEAVPATVSAVGDVWGVSNFVSRIQHGTTLIDIREIGVSPNSALRGELLQLSLVLRAPYSGGRGTD